MEALCCWLDVSFLKDPDVFDHYLTSLKIDERRDKVNSFRFESGRILSLGAGILLERMLGEHGIKDYSLTCEPNGKPVLSSGEIQFSLSHSGMIAVCAMSSQPIGADVEQNRPIRYKGILKYFHPDEIARIEQSKAEETEFTRIWTRKESYGKMNGTGIAYDMKQTCFIEDTNDAAYRFHELLLPGHLITVCTGADETVQFRRMELPH